MKKQSKLFLFFMVCFSFLSLVSLEAQIPGLEWNTFWGGSGGDVVYQLVTDSSGNIYCAGRSSASWGIPLNPFSGGTYDAFIYRLDSAGNLIWNTFLGGSNSDQASGITVSDSGILYIAGSSNVSWGMPINAHSGGTNDGLVACLDNSGNLLWHTFLGSSVYDHCDRSTVDGSGKVYVIGKSGASWGTPVNAYSGMEDVFVACLDSTGHLLWNTFLGAANWETGNGIHLDSPGNLYVCGRSNASWGTPVNAHSGGDDGYVACLDNSGNLLWNTFLGSASNEVIHQIVLDGSGNVYVCGNSFGSWGNPINPHSGGMDGFVACLDGSGNLLWNTFLGCLGVSQAVLRDMALDGSGNIYACGSTPNSWGSPINAHSGSDDAHIVCLDNSGNRIWNTFLGSSGKDYGFGFTLDSQGNIFLAGESDTSWGTPVQAHSGGGYDSYVAKYAPVPVALIEANGSGDPVVITQSDQLQITVTLKTMGLTDNTDYWLAYKGPSGWVHYNNTTKKWEAGLGVTHQGPLMDLNNKKVFQSEGMTPGNYTFYFGVDMNMDGKVTKSSLYKDEVKVTVTQ